MSELEVTGQEAFHLHRKCPIYQAVMPAETVGAEVAIKLWMAPPKQQMIQMATPHEPHREAWMEEWNTARDLFNQKGKEQ